MKNPPQICFHYLCNLEKIRKYLNHHTTYVVLLSMKIVTILHVSSVPRTFLVVPSDPLCQHVQKWKMQMRTVGNFRFLNVCVVSEGRYGKHKLPVHCRPMVDQQLIYSRRRWQLDLYYTYLPTTVRTMQLI